MTSAPSSSPLRLLPHYRRMQAVLPAGTILLFRLGNYYEAFFGSAEALSRALKLTLTGHRSAKMCGFPCRMLDEQRKTLTLQGFTVAVAD